MKLATIPKPDSLGEYQSFPGRVRDALYDLDMAERSYRMTTPKKPKKAAEGPSRAILDMDFGLEKSH
jgi:hypothetical protein